MSDQLNTGSDNAIWGGIFLSILGSLSWQDIIRTIILGIIGTVVSFIISALLRKMSEKIKK
jgi:fructose-specific phosphotransferase system IIC component